MPERVAIVGSRDWPDLGLVRQYVETLPTGTVVVSGGARGVDATAAEAARNRGLAVEEHLPDYARYGRGAPLVRNGLIVARADFVVAFWDGKSRGTKNAIDQAERLGKRLFVFDKSKSASLWPSG